MTTRITAYTDIRSPFTFVAKTEIYRWEEDFGVSVDWWPYTTPLAEAFGPAEGRNDRQLRKIKYTYMHVRRLGASQGLMIRGTRRIFDPTPAHIALLQARDDGMFRACHDLMFERVFRRELDPDEPDQVRETLRELGGDVESGLVPTPGGGCGRARFDQPSGRGGRCLRGADCRLRGRAVLGNGCASVCPGAACPASRPGVRAGCRTISGFTRFGGVGVACPR